MPERLDSAKLSHPVKLREWLAVEHSRDGASQFISTRDWQGQAFEWHTVYIPAPARADDMVILAKT